MKNNFSKNKPLIIKSLLGLAVVATAVNTAILVKTKQEVAELQIAVDNIDIPKIKNSAELNQFFKSYILASGYDKVLKKTKSNVEIGRAHV